MERLPGGHEAVGVQGPGQIFGGLEAPPAHDRAFRVVERQLQDRKGWANAA